MGWKGIDPGEWARRAKDQLRDVYRESVQEVGIQMSQGRGRQSGPGIIPVVTRNLANSALIQVGRPVMVAGEDATFSTADLAAAQTLRLGDTAHLGWQARYARRINYGFVGSDKAGRTFNQPGRHFAEAIAARWPRIVEQAAVRVRVRYGS